MRIVLVPNKSSHDFSPALRFGELRYITEGLLSPFSVTQMDRLVQQALVGTTPEDYILFSSLPILNSVLSARFAHMHGRVNYLLYRNGDYTVRTVKFNK